MFCDLTRSQYWVDAGNSRGKRAARRSKLYSRSDKGETDSRRDDDRDRCHGLVSAQDSHKSHDQREDQTEGEMPIKCPQISHAPPEQLLPAHRCLIQGR